MKSYLMFLTFSLCAGSFPIRIFFSRMFPIESSQLYVLSSPRRLTQLAPGLSSIRGFFGFVEIIKSFLNTAVCTAFHGSLRIGQVDVSQAPQNTVWRLVIEG